MSKDNPTQYHTRTIDLFVKSYFEGYSALNEAADVMFSANNLENHGLFVPSFIHHIENYLAKAKIATVTSGDLPRREQANIINTRSQEVTRGLKHPKEAILMFDFDDWYDSEDSETYDGYGVLDAEVGYTFDMGVSLIVGANNLTDETPDENRNAAAGVGNQYSQWSPGGFNGQFVYTRLIYDF